MNETIDDLMERLWSYDELQKNLVTDFMFSYK